MAHWLSMNCPKMLFQGLLSVCQAVTWGNRLNQWLIPSLSFLRNLQSLKTVKHVKFVVGNNSKEELIHLFPTEYIIVTKAKFGEADRSHDTAFMSVIATDRATDRGLFKATFSESVTWRLPAFFHTTVLFSSVGHSQN